MNIIGSLVTSKMLLIGAVAAAVAIAAAGVLGYSKGKAADKQRSDLVIANMVIEAKTKLDAANKETRALGDQLQATKEEAENALQAERDTNARHVAAAVESDGRVRRAISDFASGAGTTQDSLAACRDEARRLGDVLGETLRAHAVCTGAAEAEAGTARALLAAWPVAGRVVQ